MENGQNGYSNADNSASSDSRANDSASVDERKLFVGGIHYETGEEDLREHFGKYGEIQHIKLMTDQETGRSRGFAFIIFESKDALNRVENAGDHVINGKKVDPKKAKVRPGKIFVGRLTADLTDDDIKEHFGQFGTIVEAQMPFDKIKNQRKGFCFIVFESEQTVRNLLKNPKQYIKGNEVDVKRAEPKADQMDGSMMGGGRGGRGGRGGMGGGRGGYGAQSYGGYGQGNFGGYEQSYDNYGGGGGRGGYNQRYQPY